VPHASSFPRKLLLYQTNYNLQANHSDLDAQIAHPPPGDCDQEMEDDHGNVHRDVSPEHAEEQEGDRRDAYSSGSPVSSAVRTNLPWDNEPISQVSPFHNGLRVPVPLSLSTIPGAVTFTQIGCLCSLMANPYHATSSETDGCHPGFYNPFTKPRDSSRL
jgi:hypothetical protein